ncbi:hypothetical protein PHJA_000841300 [Phtheirospermum japonicum]|uniref:Uncharacterized protein n=1 Tax=Phtheirospermum japonicum TaxID=374723 RepID=A0A830BTL0_9LAMI|nr:hypothetical protein PHJA_000841300 [Phtheirospermum japonicum]
MTTPEGYPTVVLRGQEACTFSFITMDYGAAAPPGSKSTTPSESAPAASWRARCAIACRDIVISPFS